MATCLSSGLLLRPRLCATCKAANPQEPQRRALRALPPSTAPLHSLPPRGPGTGHDRSNCTNSPCKSRSKVSTAAVFGVGAPEALVVGVVALLVFGPKGLAEAAKSLGKTVRAFQPTLREIVSASSDIRSSLEESIGLDEIRQEWNNPSGGSSPSQSRSLPPELESPGRTATEVANSLNSQRESSEVAGSTAAGNGAAASSSTSSSSNQQEGPAPPAEAAWGSAAALQEDPDIERKRAESAALAWGAQSADAHQSSSSRTESSAKPEKQDRRAEDSGDKQLSGMSIAELEAEIARRREPSKAS